ncbi:MAG TPA: hypothetical protein VGO31_02215 [Microbacteriaceae bacterium]|jgi:hypothetical protein|nr:hypothetical protein [Microbacteriaceae bacterium]
MALRFVYLAFCAALRLFVRRRSELKRDVEPLVLRQEVGGPPSRVGSAAVALVRSSVLRGARWVALA